MRTLLVAALALLAAPAFAQNDSGFMPYVGYNLETENVRAGFGYRFGASLPLPITLTAQPQIEYEFVDENEPERIQGDFNLIAELRGSDVLSPYVGAGVALLYTDADLDSEVNVGEVNDKTDVGFNLIGGVTLNPTGFGQPFAQVRYTTGEDRDAFTVQGGLILAF